MKRDEGAGRLERHRGQELLAAALRLVLGLADHQDDVPEDADLGDRGPWPSARVELLAVLDLELGRLGRREDVVGEMRRRLDAARRAARLDQHRAALGDGTQLRGP